MIWAHLDLNRNFHLDSEPIEWPFALAALGLSDDHMMGYLHFLDHNRDGSISLQVMRRTILWTLRLICHLVFAVLLLAGYELLLTTVTSHVRSGRHMDTSTRP